MLSAVAFVRKATTGFINFHNLSDAEVLTLFSKISNPYAKPLLTDEYSQTMRNVYENMYRMRHNFLIQVLITDLREQGLID